MTTIVLAHGGGAGSGLDSWAPLVALIGGYALAVIALTLRGRSSHPSPAARLVLRAPDAIERLTGVPGWAGAAVGTALWGLFTAGYGFYSDVAWHVALGRDEVLFTAPHTGIVIGLAFVFGGAVLGTLVATLSGAEVGFRAGPARVPWSMVPLGVLGASALTGFPLDEVWHRNFGIDVTMWSPTHMLMILGAGLSPIASWLALAEAKVSASGSRWARGVHAFAAWLVLQGLAAPQGEFAFGVPQFQQLFHPILVLLAGGFALVAARIVLGRGWALGIAGAGLLLQTLTGVTRDTGALTVRNGGIYLASAVAIELAAAIWGTQRRVRFAVACGVGVATIGLAGEWAWNAGAHQPWTSALLPDALLLGLVAAVGAAVLAVAYGSVVAGRRPGIPAPLLAVAGVAVLVSLALPMPRRTGVVTADVRLTPAAPGEVVVHVTLDPPDAADDARWFQTIAWQGGDLHIAEMDEVASGTFVSDEPLPVAGKVKTLIRLHRGAEMMAVPVYLPADPEIGEPEIPAADRTVAFTAEQSFLLREAHDGPTVFAALVYAVGGLAVVSWIAAYVLAASRIARRSSRVAVTVG